MTTFALVAKESRFARKTLVRDRENLFFTVGLPLLYLFIFASIFGDEIGQVSGQPGELRVATIMTASVVVIGVASAAFQNLAVTLIQDRENGVLKRLRSTPVPTWVFLGGHLLNALMASVVLAVSVAVLGFVVYDVPFTGQRTFAAVLTVLVGTIALACAAFPFTRLVKSRNAGSPMAVAVTLTLFFLSGNFFPGADMPAAMEFVANLFPIRHFFTAMLTAFNPNVEGYGFEWGHLGILALWGFGGAILGARLFRWTPTEDH